MNTAVTITLPAGIWREGICHREASLRQLTGADELFLLEVGESLPMAHRVTALLARCLTALGPGDSVTSEAVRSLTAGDREALLLHLRRLTLGDRLPCVLSCPQPDCGKQMDLALKVSDLLLPPGPDAKDRHETALNENGRAYRVYFRLPTGADQEAAAAFARSRPESAADLLLGRCVEKVTAEDSNSEAVEDWPSAVARHLPAMMAECDPQAELTLNLSCPECGHDFSALFDTASYFFQELAGSSRFLYQEVHLLAFYQHWSEAEIMNMPSQRRRQYLESLGETLGEERRR